MAIDRFLREDCTPVLIVGENYRERRQKKVQGWARCLFRVFKKKECRVSVPNFPGSNRRYFKEILQEEVGIEKSINGHGKEKKMFFLPNRGQP